MIEPKNFPRLMEYARKLMEECRNDENLKGEILELVKFIPLIFFYSFPNLKKLINDFKNNNLEKWEWGS